MTTEEQLALAVLKGDKSAIAPFLDCLMEQYKDGGTQLFPRQIVGTAKNLRAVLYYRDGPNLEPNYENINEHVLGWLRGEGTVLQVTGVDRIEVYEFPSEETE